MTDIERKTTEIVVSVPTVAKAVGIFFAIVLTYLVRDACSTSRWRRCSSSASIRR